LLKVTPATLVKNDLDARGGTPTGFGFGGAGRFAISVLFKQFLQVTAEGLVVRNLPFRPHSVSEFFA
jgi:hypothetical protein